MTSYGALLRTPRMARLYSAMVVARMSIGIDGIATVLFLRHEGRSFALAGAASGALALGAAFGAPFMARLIDRLGARVLAWLALGHAAGLIVLIALAVAGAPGPLLVLVAFASGLTLPTVSSVMRGSYTRLLKDRPALIPSAFALEAVITESIFVVGPLATAALAWVQSAAAALVLSAITVVAGTVWFLNELPDSIAERRTDMAGRHWAGALRSRGLRTIVVAMVPVGFAFGAVEVMLPAFADAEGDRSLAGVLIAIWSVGSALGGIVYGMRPRLLSLRAMHLWMAAAVPLMLAPLALAPSALAMCVLALFAGLPIAPLIATRNELAGVVAYPGSETETFTWPLTAMVSGIALGAAAAGALADGPGWRAAGLAAVAASALGAVLTLARRRTLEPVAAAAA